MPRDRASAAAGRPSSRARRYRLRWRDWTLAIKATTDYLAAGQTHIEVTVERPEGAPLPITETGYRSHFIDSEMLAHAGGAVAFVRDWLDREARSKAWHKTEAAWRQLELELVVPQPEATRRTVAKPKTRPPAKPERT